MDTDSVHHPCLNGVVGVLFCEILTISSADESLKVRCLTEIQGTVSTHRFMLVYHLSLCSPESRQ